MKKKVFIGSSSEALEIVNKVKQLLEVSYEVLTWDKSFVLNNSSLDCLIENAIKTDYAIFIGTADDNVVANDRERYAREGENSKNRDNVVFEFGLFLGILGKPNCVYMTDKESKVMSDMDGITRIVFDKLDLNESIPSAVEQIVEHFNSQKGVDVNVFPSTHMAFSYFSNFIKPIWDHYQYNDQSIRPERSSKKFSNCEIVIIIPNIVSDNMSSRFEQICAKTKMANISIKSLGRSRNLIVDRYPVDKDMVIYDMPTSLCGVEFAIKNFLPKDNAGCEQLIKREIKRFGDSVLQLADRYHNILPIRIIDEDLFLNEIEAKIPRKSILRISFLRK